MRVNRMSDHVAARPRQGAVADGECRVGIMPCVHANTWVAGQGLFRDDWLFILIPERRKLSFDPVQEVLIVLCLLFLVEFGRLKRDFRIVIQVT